MLWERKKEKKQNISAAYVVRSKISTKRMRLGWVHRGLQGL